MLEQFNSIDMLHSFKEYLDKQSEQDSEKGYWYGEDTFRPGKNGIQIRCEGLHSFLAHPERVFDCFNEKDLITELDCLYNLIVKKKYGFKAPCYEFTSDLLQKGIKPPEFIETVCMCFITISGLALALSAKGELSPKYEEKTLEMLGRALNWLNSSWSLGPPVIKGEQKGIGWGGFKTPGHISLYATWAVISILPTIKKVDAILDGKRKRAVAELHGFLKNVELWLKDFGNRQEGGWEAGEWKVPKEGIIYNVYGLSAFVNLMLYLPHSGVKSALEDQSNQNFLRTLVQDILNLWERSEEMFAEKAQIDVGAIVKGKWQNIHYDDCSIVPMALYVLCTLCSNFEKDLKGMTRTDEEKEGEVLYDSIECAIPKMFEYIKNHYWDVERTVVTKPIGESGKRRFCIYMTDRVVHAIATYENWENGKEKSKVHPPREHEGTQRLLWELEAIKRDIVGLRKDLGIRLTKMEQVIKTEIRFIPGKVLEISEAQQQYEQEQRQEKEALEKELQRQAEQEQE